MNFVIKLSTALAIALTLTACGGGGGGKSNNGGSNTPSGNTTNGSIGNNTNSSTGNGTDNNQTGNNTNDNTTNPPHPYSYGYACDGEVIVNGYLLPPCSDPKLNDSTLLGIDSNNNGVRDDVERWLIVKYKNDHKIVTEIGFQGARAYQIVIQEPSKARETTKLVEAAQACESYFEIYAQYQNEPILLNNDFLTSTAFKTVQLNTEQRIRAYLAYDKALSGGVYTLPKGSKAHRVLCTFDIDKLLGKEWKYNRRYI